MTGDRTLQATAANVLAVCSVQMFLFLFHGGLLFQFFSAVLSTVVSGVTRPIRAAFREALWIEASSFKHPRLDGCTMRIVDKWISITGKQH